jgi:SAM-dependent methyltransferase
MDLDKYVDKDIETKHHGVAENLWALQNDPDHNGAQVSIYRSIPKLGNNKLLEIGPAGGFGSYFMRSLGFDVKAISIIQQDVDNLKKYNIPADLGDMHTLPYGDGSFSHVLASHVLEHSPAPLIVLKEIFRVLSTPGYLIIILPPWNSSLNGMKIADYSHHVACLTPDSWKFLLKKVGFQLEKYEEVPQFTTKPGTGRVIEYHHEYYLCRKGQY